MVSHEFVISKSEIDRRVTALTTLIVSIFLGLICWSLLTSLGLIHKYFWFSATFILAFIIVFTVIRELIIKFFRSFLQTKISLSDQFLDRRTLNSHKRYLLKDITKIFVKKTTRGSIREVGVSLTGGRSLFINGLSNFEHFKEKLIALTGNNIEAKESVERIDYDHPAFYLILGQVLSFSTIYTLKFITRVNHTQLQVIYFICTTYIFLLGGYFAFNRPLAKRYGEKMQKTDYICGLLMMGISTAIFSWRLSN